MEKQKLTIANSVINTFGEKETEPLLPTTDREYSRDKASKKLELPQREYDDDVEPLLPPHLSIKEDDHGE